jgi:predicted molibdopterin-dependent oxidoreductase YjgC
VKYYTIHAITGEEESAWSVHLHPLVRCLLEQDGHMLSACHAEVNRLMALVTRRNSMWTNAKQQLAGKMQQNMEVCECPTCETHPHSPR